MQGYLGIDAGTQGISVVFADQQVNVLATGEGSYDMLPNLGEGCYEQDSADWERALSQAMADLRGKLDADFNVLCIGISGQMHGEVLADESGKVIVPVRLWCDARNEHEGELLTHHLGVKMPKRITSARWLWTISNRAEIASRVRHLTTSSGWLAYRLTGKWNLGIGDAAGMFPIDETTQDYDRVLLRKFEDLVPNDVVFPIEHLLPQVKVAGEDAGMLNEFGAKLLGLKPGIPVAPAEGDQPAAMAGSLIGSAGMVSISFGTSVCANSIGDRPFQGVSNAVDHFCAPDGKPINMVWLRNGTTYMNSLVEMFGRLDDGNDSDCFVTLMPQVAETSPDCGGLLALPFMEDEPGLGINVGGTALIVGLNSQNATPGNVVKAGLLSTMFNLRWGSEVLDQQGFPRKELVLSGGLTKTPELAQVLADVFETPVTLLKCAEEGTAWGAALLAKFRFEKLQGESGDWATFLASIARRSESQSHRSSFKPIVENSAVYHETYHRYRKLIEVQPQIEAAVVH